VAKTIVNAINVFTIVIVGHKGMAHLSFAVFAGTKGGPIP